MGERSLYIWCIGIIQIIFCIGLQSLQAQCPEIQFIYADACEAPDGKGEFLVLQSDSLALAIDDMTLEVPTGDSYGMSASDDANWEKPDVSNLNSLAGCGSLFTAIGPGDTLPAGGRLIIFTNRKFKDDVDWSNYCGVSNFYVVTIDKVDNTNKYPHNEGGSYPVATTSISFDGTGGCGGESVSYDPSMLDRESPTGSGGGPSISFDASGGAIYKDVGCSEFNVEAVVMEEISIAFHIQLMPGSVQAQWTVEGHSTPILYELIRRDPEGRTDKVAFIKHHPISSQLYHWKDYPPKEGTFSYQLIVHSEAGSRHPSDWKEVSWQSTSHIDLWLDGKVLMLENLTGNDGMLSIINLQGIQHQMIPIESGHSPQRFTLPHLSPGMYVAFWHPSGNGQGLVRRFFYEDQ